MEYKIEVLFRAQIEIEKACDYYSKINKILPEKFLKKLDSTYRYLRLNPHFRKRYKNVRSIPVSHFPYLLFYTIDENKRKVKVISCFQTSQNSKKYPK